VATVDDLATLRREYQSRPFDEADADPDPFRQFDRWFVEVSAAGLAEPNAAVLATVSAQGRPSARHVLVKAAGDGGFVFYTNYRSRKAGELALNPSAALVFTWSALSRQVVVEGEVAKVPVEVSDRYFAQRPRGSQLGAWASPQSQPLADRAALDVAFAEAEARFDGIDVPRPPHWGGYRLTPDRIEFWQGRLSRLHDRISYELAGSDTGWHRQRLAP
jgi:pyridoxamine 5'-phosphate oxidase